jgi:2'-5' RNA ligase
MKRLFFALPIPARLKKQVFGLFPKKTFHGIRFTPEENLHITVHFLGATPEEKIPELIQSAKEISDHTSSFELKFDSFKTIEKNKKPVMIWAQFGENDDFEKLCLKLRSAFPTNENRKPNPHATIARIKQLKQLPVELPKENPFSFVVDQLELFESLTHPEGAQYKLTDHWKFR